MMSDATRRDDGKFSANKKKQIEMDRDLGSIKIRSGISKIDFGIGSLWGSPIIPSSIPPAGYRVPVV
jgi:hypothetical protein